MRFTIDEYCKRFKMSKEMVNSKLKSKKLNYIIEDGKTYIIVTKSSLTEPSKHTENLQTDKPKPKTTVATVISLYQRENTALKEKIMQLEIKIDKLIDDKEQMLRDERDRIEELYTTKDAQLKNILELVNNKMLLEKESQSNNNTVHDVESFDISEPEDDKIVELKEYLKSLGLKSSKRKAIKKKFLDAYDSDHRIILSNGKLYLDFNKYDYRDLLA